MKRVVKNIYSYKEEKGKDFSKFPSMTEPDLALSVREIQTMFSSGSLPHIGFIGQTDHEDISFEDYERFMDMDYDLDDYTQDMLRLIELDKKVQQDVKRKKEIREEHRMKEQNELQKLREFKQKYEQSRIAADSRTE